MAQTPDWKRYLEAGMQQTELRRSQARAVAAGLVGQGQLARDQVGAAVDEIVAMSRRRSDALREVVRSEVQKQLSSVGLATQADLRRLEKKLNSAVKKSARDAAKRASSNAAKKTAGKKSASKRAG
jgi:polyhydroxyalkanoate synthesis regulator phasin